MKKILTETEHARPRRGEGELDGGEAARREEGVGALAGDAVQVEGQLAAALGGGGWERLAQLRRQTPSARRARCAVGARFETILSPRPRSPGWAQTRRGRRCLRSGQVGCARSTSRPSPCAHGSCPGPPSRRPSPSAFSETPSARLPPSSGHPRTPRCSSPPLPVPGRSSKRRPSPAAGFALRRPPHSVFL